MAFNLSLGMFQGLKPTLSQSIRFSGETKPESSPVQMALGQIPPEEQLALDDLFRHAVRQDLLGYPVYGKKPMAWVTLGNYRYDEQQKRIVAQYPDRKKWRIWLRHRHKFAIKDFIFRPVTAFHGKQLTDICIMNKKSLLRQFKQHLADFKKVLGEKVTPGYLLKRMETNNPVSTAILKNQLLLGTLLGYGRNNAAMFQRRSELADPEKDQDIPVEGGGYKLKMIAKEGVAPTPPFATAQAELDDIQRRFGYDDMVFGIYLTRNEERVSPPAFMSDKADPETGKIKASYQRTQRLLARLVKKPDFLEKFMKKLTGEKA